MSPLFFNLVKAIGTLEWSGPFFSFSRKACGLGVSRGKGEDELTQCDLFNVRELYSPKCNMILQKICPNQDRDIESREEGEGLGRDKPAFYECEISLVEGTLSVIQKLFFRSKALRKKCVSVVSQIDHQCFHNPRCTEESG